LLRNPKSNAFNKTTVTLPKSSHAMDTAATEEAGSNFMNAFESLVATLMRHEGFWVHPSFRVELTREDKLEINRHSNARWEMDLICYKPAGNLIRAVECKSYLDSTGVKHADLAGGRYAERYKLFTEKGLWDVIKNRLIAQLERAGLCGPSPKIELCLATGKLACDDDRPKLKELAAQRGWTLLDDQWLLRSLEALASRGYEDEIATIVAKLLVRAKPAKAGQ
jgi:hypothetical protein